MILTSLTFGIPEVTALFTNVANTLSDYSWAELDVTRWNLPVHTIAWYASLIVWLVFVIAITAHIWWRLT
jgi:hypothetical protein